MRADIHLEQLCTAARKKPEAKIRVCRVSWDLSSPALAASATPLRVSLWACSLVHLLAAYLCLATVLKLLMAYIGACSSLLGGIGELPFPTAGLFSCESPCQVIKLTFRGPSCCYAATPQSLLVAWSSSLTDCDHEANPSILCCAASCFSAIIAGIRNCLVGTCNVSASSRFWPS